mmetsp:Transcript_13168/g.16402  ORF Transcript_13168/g.16402 Transcript_13168/m.16402 type:complete len:371 (-) Transcript_13168:575-1687(-)
MSNSTSTSSCNFPILAPGGNGCSGNGVCLEPRGVCFCETGIWSSVGDFTLEPQDCDIHIKTVRVLWGTVILVHGLCALLCCYYLCIMFIVLGGKFRKSTPIYAFFILLANVMFVSVGTLKVTRDQLPIVGVDEALTVMFSIGAGTYWFCALYFLDRFARLFAYRAEQMGGTRKPMRVPRVLSIASITVFFFSPMICLADKANCSIYGRIHYLSILPLMVAVSIIWNYGFIKNLVNDIESLITQFENVMPAETMEEKGYDSLLSNLKFFHKQARDQGTTNIILALLMMWPFMLRKASYQLPIAWASGGLIAIASVFVTCNNEQQAVKSRRSKMTTKTNESPGHETDKTYTKKITRQDSAPELSLDIRPASL